LGWGQYLLISWFSKTASKKIEGGNYTVAARISHDLINLSAQHFVEHTDPQKGTWGENAVDLYS
jgi:hypothetical protein